MDKVILKSANLLASTALLTNRKAWKSASTHLVTSTARYFACVLEEDSNYKKPKTVLLRITYSIPRIVIFALYDI